MKNLILEDGVSVRRHRQQLSELLAECTDIVRISSPYVTERQFLTASLKHEVRLLTTLSPIDIAIGATSIESLNALIQLGVKCRCLPARPKLHAKVYIFGTSHAVVTSANFTTSALDSNIEVGVKITGENASSMTAWFDRLWEIASPVTAEHLAELKHQTSKLRREFAQMKAKAKSMMPPLSISETKSQLTDSLHHFFATATRFFVCNTDRSEGSRTETGGYLLEEEMHSRGFAAAWEDFKHPSHMKLVEKGSAIFMFAKKVGIIGVGVATGPCEMLTSSQAGRLTLAHTGVEWRIPIRWLAWTDADGAYRWNKALNATFWDVSGSQYDGFRDGVMLHFLGAE